MSTNTITTKAPQLKVIQSIICNLCTYYGSEEVKRIWRLICQDREEEKRKMTDNDNNNVVKNNEYKPTNLTFS